MLIILDVRYVTGVCTALGEHAGVLFWLPLSSAG